MLVLAVTLLDMGDVEGPDVSVGDLSILRLQWPLSVVSGLARQQLELEQLRHACNKRYRGAQTGLCSFCGKVIKLDLARHVANYHLELAQLWRCPVSCCTQLKGMPQDCVDHMRLSHAVLATVKASNLGKWFPLWMVSRETWRDALNPHVSGVSTDVLLFSENGASLIHHYRVFGRGGAPASLRGKYMPKLRAFTVQAEAEARWARNRDPARSSSLPIGTTHPRGIRQR